MKVARPMPSPHPTLCLADVFPPTKNDLGARFAKDDLFLTYNARGAFYQLLQAIPESKGGVVLLPALHCTSLVEPVARSPFKAAFYRIKPDLTIDMDDLRSKANPDVVLIVVVHYFGFPTDLRQILELGQHLGVEVLEDCAHSFLTLDGGQPIGYRGDYSIFSYYKTVPSLFGGGLRVNRRKLDLAAPRRKIALRESAVITKRLLEHVIRNSREGLLKRTLLYLEGLRVTRKRGRNNANVPSAPGFVDDPYLFREDLALSRIPALCQWILKYSNWHLIADVRRRNYELLTRVLKDNSLLQKPLPHLPLGVCPWAYPVLLRGRTSFEHQLRERGVPLFTFGELLHPLLDHADERTRRDAHELSHQLLMLPIHQNLSSDEVTRYAETINQFLASAEGPFAHRIDEQAGSETVATRTRS